MRIDQRLNPATSLQRLKIPPQGAWVHHERIGKLRSGLARRCTSLEPLPRQPLSRAPYSFQHYLR